MSFEEWKEMMLRRSGQDPAGIKSAKPRDHHRPSAEAPPVSLDSLGDDGEIALQFDALSDKVSELTGASPSSPDASPGASGTAGKEDQVFYDDGKTQYYRSKDAGKTCKERFSYASFDAGATILKTSPGAKNAKAILVENKDSYMLLECRTKNKFVIVELSDDILVDTIVLANFEFFSSMIRRFRVSVSDRYPVKLDKWVVLGTFEARNSRDIQPFLVEHPQIYTKYIRIEFLTHYGNEYYCPVSLLRIHGTRMLDTWKEPDNNQDDEVEQIEASAPEQVPETNQTRAAPPEEPSSKSTVPDAVVPEAVVPDTAVPEAQAETEIGSSPWLPIFCTNYSLDMCALRSPTTGEPTPVSLVPSKNPDAVTPNPSTAIPGRGTVQSTASFSQPASATAEAISDRTPPGDVSSSSPSATPSAANNTAANNLA